jgi:PAS domain S-box-containing protein
MKRHLSPLQVVTLYVVFGTVWILFSDTALHALVQDAELENRLQTVKGWIFTFVTGGVAYWLLSRLVTDLKKRNIESKLAERAFLESEERFRVLVEHAPEAITMIDGDTGLYVDVNPVAEALHGLPRDELIGKLGPADLSPVLQPDGRRSSEAAMDYLSLALAGELPRFEWKHLSLDGEEALCEICLAQLPDPHRNLVRASITDITDRKAAEAQRAELEAELAQAQKMEAVGQLTAGVAHDFNNLLAVILGNAELLQDELVTDKPGLIAIIRATGRGADLTQRLLAFSRKQVLSPEIINANNLIAGITAMLHRTLEEHIDIENVAAADLWNCDADPAQLENALVNLAINARDAMPDGGKLTIETANARLDDDYAAAQADVKPGQYVMIAVTDTGSGMPPEVREQVFEPFFTTKKVGAGSGLGLSMVYGIVKQSGGNVTIYSEEGEGTTIKLYLPRSTETEVAETKPATNEVPVARGETVLVVEDDPDLRTLAVALLSDLGYQVKEAATGPAALGQLGSTTRANLLLTDVVLPGGMNGRELATEANRRAFGIKVLYMSGYPEDAIMHHGRLDADVELLQKPFRKADLARAVRKVLDNPSA